MRTVSLSEILRPWDNLGVEFFLADYPIDMNTPNYPKHAQARQEARTKSEVAKTSKQRVTQSAEQGTRGSQLNASQGSVQRDSKKDSSAAASTRATYAEQRQQRKVDAKAPRPVEDKKVKIEWPDEYTKIFSKLSPAPVLWTYSQLGLDLSDQSDPDRSACLRSLIQQLNLPRGTSVFWPFSLPTDGEVKDNIPVFFDGVEQLNPRAIIVVGQSGMKPFADDIDLTLPFTQVVHRGRMIMLLPEFTQLVSVSSFIENSVNYLRSGLTGLNIIR